MVIPYHIAILVAVYLRAGWRIIVCGGDVKHRLALIQLRQEPLVFIHWSRMPLSAPFRPEEEWKPVSGHLKHLHSTLQLYQKLRLSRLMIRIMALNLSSLLYTWLGLLTLNHMQLQLRMHSCVAAQVQIRSALQSPIPIWTSCSEVKCTSPWRWL